MAERGGSMTAALVCAVAVMRTEAAGQALARAARGILNLRLEVHVGTFEALHHTAGRGADAQALLLEVDLGDPHELARLRAFIAERCAGLAVIAVAADASLADARRLLHIGVADVIAPAAEAADIEAALAHALRGRQAAAADATPARGRVIALLKAGGGVGATTIAVQAGCLLAAGASARPACVLDLDVQFGSAALYLDLDARVGLADLLEAPERLDSALLHGAMGRHACGLDVLAAPSEIAPLEALTPAAVDLLVDLARRDYGTVLIDLPQAWTPWSAAALTRADAILLVAQLTVASIRQARRQLDRLQREGFTAGATRLVLNRYSWSWPWSWGARARCREAERALGRPFDAVVANDFPLVREAIDRGVPLRAVRRRSRVERGLRGLLAGLDDAARVAPAPTAPGAVLSEA